MTDRPREVPGPRGRPAFPDRADGRRKGPTASAAGPHRGREWNRSGTDIAHGRTHAVLLPHVIRCNGTVPGKLTGWPKYEHYRAPERFQDIARTLGLPATTPKRA